MRVTDHAIAVDPFSGTASCALMRGWEQVHFSSIAASATYAQIAGVMAAITFAALVLVLQHDGGDAQGRRIASAFLVIASSLLLIAAFFYVEISGEGSCAVASTLLTAAGMVFAAGALLAFVAVAWLLLAYLQTGIARFASHVAILITSSMIGVYGTLGVDTPATLMSGHRWMTGTRLLILLLGGLFLFVGGFVALRRVLGTARKRAIAAVAVVGLVATAASAWTAWATFESPAFLNPRHPSPIPGVYLVGAVLAYGLILGAGVLAMPGFVDLGNPNRQVPA